MEENKAIGIYMLYRVIQFIVNMYDGFFIYGFYLVTFSLLGYYSFVHREWLGEMIKNWKVPLGEVKSKVSRFLLEKLLRKEVVV